MYQSLVLPIPGVAEMVGEISGQSGRYVIIGRAWAEILAAVQDQEIPPISDVENLETARFGQSIKSQTWQFHAVRADSTEKL